MRTKEGRILTVNALAAALLGALATQVLHEAGHGVAALAVGAEWQAFNLFAVLWEWPSTPDDTGALIIEASPALLNILAGTVAALVLMQARGVRPMLHLFLMYLAGFSMFMGFGYLLVDPLLYRQGGEQLGDWWKVLDLLGGSWAVRIPLMVVGAAGALFGFYFLAKSTLRFTPDGTDKKERLRVALPLLLIPYLVIAVLFTLLAVWHPLGAEGVFVVALQYWFGYIGFFWAFFLAAYWLDVKAPLENTLALPGKLSTAWVVAAGCVLVLSVAVLLPTLWFV